MIVETSFQFRQQPDGSLQGRGLMCQADYYENTVPLSIVQITMRPMSPPQPTPP